MRTTWLLAGVASTFLTGNALAETSVVLFGSDNIPLLSPVLSLTQPSVTNVDKPDIQTLVAVPLKFDLGRGFQTQVEGSAVTGTGPRLGNLPTGAVSATSVMFNALYDVQGGSWRFKPFVGAGFGMVDANARILGQTDSDWVTAYQLHGGVSLGFSQKIVGSLEYRWTEGSRPDFAISGIRTKLDINRHGFVVGLNFKY